MYFNQLEEQQRSVRQGPDEDRLKSLHMCVDGLMRSSQDADFTVYLRQLKGRLNQQEQQISALTEELDRNVRLYESNLRMRAAQGQVMPQPAPEEPVQPAPQEQKVPQPAPQIYVQAAPRGETKRKHSAEYIVGVSVLSIVGAAFILTAMVLLGMYFMEGLTKGLMLYAVCLAVMLLSELLLYRRWQGLGMTFSAIGMGGLYISTLINYLILHNFNQWAALGLTLLITLAVLLLSRKRDAAAYRILGMIATYVCILLVPGSEVLGNGLSLTEFATAAVMALLVNVMCLAVPVRKSHTGIHVTHMALNTTFTFIAYFSWAQGPGKLIGVSDAVWQQQLWQRPLFLAVSLLVMQLIFVAQVRWQERQTPGGPMSNHVGICVTYGVSIQAYMALAFLATDFYAAASWAEWFGDPYLFNRVLCSAVVVLFCLIPVAALRQRQEKWLGWYLLLCLTAVIHLGHGNSWEKAIFLLAALAASKMLSFAKKPFLYGSDAAVTLCACLYVAFGWEKASVVPLAAGLLLSVLCLNYWHVYFQLSLAFTIAFYAANHMLSVLRLPVFVGILFVAMLLFNNVKRWRGCEKGILCFNAFTLGGQAVAYLFLINPVYQNAYLTYLCMLIFGVAVFVVCFQKKYQLDLKHKQLLFMVFLTYMGLVVRTDYPIVNSILLMAVALIGVGIGFVIQKKSVRIYGLVLSLVICAKLVLYDFMGANVLQKTILFFVVGVIALMIATIYMLLEHGQEKKYRNQAVAERIGDGGAAGTMNENNAILK